MPSASDEGGVTVSISEGHFVNIAADAYPKPKAIFCGECDDLATRRVEKEISGIIKRTYFCKRCFDTQSLSKLRD